jgi:hypothetical protein
MQNNLNETLGSLKKMPMHSFNDVQKEFIHKLNNSQSRTMSIYALLGDFIKKEKTKFIIDCDKASVIINICHKPELRGNDLNDYLEAQIHDVEILIISLCNIIRYLKKNEMISLYIPKGNSIDNFGYAKTENEVSSVRTFADSKLDNIIIDYANHNVMTTPDLIEFEKRGFLSKGDHDFNVQLKWTRIAILISSLIGFSGVYYAANKQDHDNLNQISDQIKATNFNIVNSLNQVHNDLKIHNKNLAYICYFISDYLNSSKGESNSYIEDGNVLVKFVKIENDKKLKLFTTSNSANIYKSNEE